MILGIEIALAVYGLFGLIAGTLIVSKSKVVQGYRARLLGSLALVPIVAAFVLIFTVADSRALNWIEGGIAGGTAVLVFALGALTGVDPDAERPVPEEEGAFEAGDPPNSDPEEEEPGETDPEESEPEDTSSEPPEFVANNPVPPEQPRSRRIEHVGTISAPVITFDKRAARPDHSVTTVEKKDEPAPELPGLDPPTSIR